MDKTKRYYMRYGKHVVYNGKRYTLLDDMGDNDTVTAVRCEHERRYRLLTAWSKNDVGVTDEQREEMKGYEEQIVCDECIPDDVIRFITPNYDTLFEVKNFGHVLVNGERRMVAYLDDYHFAFVHGGIYHICEFAEIREKNGIRLEKCDE